MQDWTLLCRSRNHKWLYCLSSEGEYRHFWAIAIVLDKHGDSPEDEDADATRKLLDYQIELLGIAYGAVEFKFRGSKHSFTGFVLERHFDDGGLAVAFREEAEVKIGYFTTVRVISEEQCYVSVPFL